MLKDYYQYPGKVIEIENVNATVQAVKGGSKTELRHIPVIEYYTKKDTSSFSEGKFNLFSFYDVGDEVTVLERKDDSYKASILSFWYYFLSIPELIVLLMLSFIKFGFYIKFIKKS